MKRVKVKGHKRSRSGSKFKVTINVKEKAGVLRPTSSCSIFICGPRQFILIFEHRLSMDCKDIRSPLLKLPEVVASQILGYLTWQEKLQFIETVPQWNGFLLTPNAWKYFHTDYECVLSRKHLREVHEKVCDIVATYGKFLQHLEVTLQYLDLSDLGFSLLELVSRHCTNLKTLCVYHPACFTLPVEDQFHRYVPGE